VAVSPQVATASYDTFLSFSLFACLLVVLVLVLAA